MKNLKINNSQFDSSSYAAASPRRLSTKKKERNEFEFFLEEFLKDEAKELDEYPVLLPRHGRFWDNGYEDVESKESKGGRL